MAARTTLITSIFLSPKLSRIDVELGLLLDRGRGSRRRRRAGHHHRAAGGRLDAVDVLQVVAQLLGLLERQADDLVAQVLGQVGILQWRSPWGWILSFLTTVYRVVGQYCSVSIG